MVGFSSPKRSKYTVSVAAQHAKNSDAELVLVRIIPDPKKVGVIATLISSDRPVETAQHQIDQVVEQLKAEGVKASGLVRVGEVAPDIIKVAKELSIDVLFVGTMNFDERPRFLMARDPIVSYLVERCPISLFLVRQEHSPDIRGSELIADQQDI